MANEPNFVYILTEEDDYDGPTILGVFATGEDAQAAADDDEFWHPWGRIQPDGAVFRKHKGGGSGNWRMAVRPYEVRG